MVRHLFLLLLAFVLTTSTASSQASRVRLNQIGFYPESPKVAVVVDVSPGEFYVTTPDQSQTLFTGLMGSEQTWTPSGEKVRLADFSAFQAEGEYVLVAPGAGISYPFRISSRVHQSVAKAALKGFYYQRASTALAASHAGSWARPAGHPDKTVYVHPSAASTARPANTIIAAPRGWYDAGDYNKYIVNSGITMGTLLALYEHFPAYFSELELGIPESGNGVPDLLDEVLWNLRWMLAMQDPNDGGVYHKLTNANFDGMVMPHQATSQRWVVQKSTAATLDFAAVMAMAARIYDDFSGQFPGLADSCLTAARAAWDWAEANPNVRYSQSAVNQAYNPDINTGEYGDGYFGDEFRWAAAELFLTTGETSTIESYTPFGEQSPAGVPGWPNVGSMAFISLAHHRSIAAPTLDTLEIKRRIVNRADILLNRQQNSAYRVVMETGDFYWGSNAVAANQGMMLIQAYRWTKDIRYLEAALANLDYLLGRNGTGYSFVTGYGDKTPLYPHHRPSEADGVFAPVPGLLAGGPNPNREDDAGCAQPYPSTLAAKAYLDDVCSYASNEIAINWNAPLVYLAGSIEALLAENGLPVAAERSLPESASSLPILRHYPDPADTRATIEVDTPAAGPAVVEVFDVLGRRVSTLAAAFLPAGKHLFPLDTHTLGSGTYFIRLLAGTGSHTSILRVAH